eukprot:m.163427 g.163427  ORF g.163427 m.163427 type:complete len:66 (-) comp24915_c0_seq3:117-314(-)
MIDKRGISLQLMGYVPPSKAFVNGKDITDTVTVAGKSSLSIPKGTVFVELPVESVSVEQVVEIWL